MDRDIAKFVPFRVVVVAERHAVFSYRPDRASWHRTLRQVTREQPQAKQASTGKYKRSHSCDKAIAELYEGLIQWDDLSACCHDVFIDQARLFNEMYSELPDTRVRYNLSQFYSQYWFPSTAIFSPWG